MLPCFARCAACSDMILKPIDAATLAFLSFAMPSPDRAEPAAKENRARFLGCNDSADASIPARSDQALYSLCCGNLIVA